MYAVGSSMPLDEFSVVAPSTSQSSYNEGNILRFIIPRNLGFVDTSNSYLELEVDVVGNNYPMTFSNDCGADMLIEFIKFSQNGVQLEQIDEYNKLAQIYKCYGETFNERQRKSAKDCSRVSNSSQQNNFKEAHTNPTFAPRLGGAGTSDLNFAMSKKVYLDLNITGMFSMTSLLPLAALGDIEVEIRFAPNKEVLIVDPNVKQKHFCDQISDGATTITLDKRYKGFLNLGQSPFVVGMKVQPKDSDGTSRTEATISAIQEDKDGTITLTTTAVTTGNTTTTNNTIEISAGKDGNVAVASATYSVAKANMYLQIVRPPPEYMNALMRQVGGSGLTLDMHTWTCYKGVVKKELPSQTLEVPCYSMRAKSMITALVAMAPTLSQRVDNSQDYDANGHFEDLETYQYQTGEKRHPTRPVDVSSLSAPMAPKPSCSHNHELSKALMASNIPYSSFRRQLECFVIARAYGRYGATTNLSTTGGSRIYLDYASSSKPSIDLQALTWCNHINRVIVSEKGLQVFS